MRCRSLLVLAVLFLGCVSPQGRLSAFNDNWVGRPFDDFVRTYGAPATEYTMSDGNKLYNFSAGGCVLRIEADLRGSILGIQIQRDPVGLVVLSRCFEVLPSD